MLSGLGIRDLLCQRGDMIMGPALILVLVFLSSLICKQRMSESLESRYQKCSKDLLFLDYLPLPTLLEKSLKRKSARFAIPIIPMFSKMGVSLKISCISRFQTPCSQGIIVQGIESIESVIFDPQHCFA